MAPSSSGQKIEGETAYLEQKIAGQGGANHCEGEESFELTGKSSLQTLLSRDVQPELGSEYAVGRMVSPVSKAQGMGAIEEKTERKKKELHAPTTALHSHHRSHSPQLAYRMGKAQPGAQGTQGRRRNAVAPFGVQRAKTANTSSPYGRTNTMEGLDEEERKEAEQKEKERKRDQKDLG